MESGGLRCSGEALRRLETRATSCCERDFILEWRDDLSVILRSSRGFSIDRFSTEASEAFSGDVTLLTESWEGWKEVGFFLLTSVSLSGNYSINDFTHAHYSDGRMFTRTKPKMRTHTPIKPCKNAHTHITLQKCSHPHNLAKVLTPT